MEKSTKYDTIINFLLDYWIIAVIVIIATIIAFIPSLRNGIIEITKIIKLVFHKKKKDFVIKYNGETVTFEYKIKSALFDLVKINAFTHHLGVNAEYKWIEEYYPDYKTQIQSFSKIKVNETISLHFDTLTIKNNEGHKKKIYFDISAFFNDSGHSSSDLDKFARNKIRELYDKK